MRQILVLGAGHSAPYLIRHLLDRAGSDTGGGWRVVVADRDAELAARRVGGHPRGEPTGLDADDPPRREALIAAADLVVNLLPPSFQVPVARDCVRLGRHMVSASYAAPELRALSAEAARRGVLLLAEIGLDPGIDHMSTMALLDRLRGEGAAVESFESYGSGVPAPDSIANPFAYAVTWNPRNVVTAGAKGARYLRRGRVRIVPPARVLAETWPVAVDGVGPMEAYANRDSLPYRDTFGLATADTVVRATLRHPGFCAAWRQVVRLGLTGDEIAVPRLGERSWGEVVDMFLPEGTAGATVEKRAAHFLGLDGDDPALAALRWLGLFSDEPAATDTAGTAAEALIALIQEKLVLPPGGRDLVILRHELIVRRPGDAAPRRERVTSTLVEFGEPGGITAMAKTVGLPTAIAARLILAAPPTHTGCQIPTEPAIYQPILRELEREGLRFVERVEPVEATAAAPAADSVR